MLLLNSVQSLTVLTFCAQWMALAALLVPGSILPLGCAILSTRAITVRGVGTTPLRRTRVKVPGTLALEFGYHPRKINHVIRVVFRTGQCTRVHRFRGAQTYKIGKKSCFFGHSDKFWKGHDGQIKKNACKNA